MPNHPNPTPDQLLARPVIYVISIFNFINTHCTSTHYSTPPPPDRNLPYAKGEVIRSLNISLHIYTLIPTPSSPPQKGTTSTPPPSPSSPLPNRNPTRSPQKNKSDRPMKKHTYIICMGGRKNRLTVPLRGKKRERMEMIWYDMSAKKGIIYRGHGEREKGVLDWDGNYCLGPD